MNLIKKLSRCYCHKLTPDVGHKPGWFERLLMKVLPHCDIIKTIGDCRRCHNSGFSGYGTGYDAVCDDCGGQSVYAQTVLYLRRFYLWRSKWIGKNWGDIYIHHIVRSDDDPDPHDHPWGFRGLVLKNGYLDKSYTWEQPGKFGDGRGFRIGPSYERVLPWTWIKRDATHIHQVHLAPGFTAWTLIFTSGEYREWSFITESGPVHWRRYLNIPDGE